MKVGDVIQFSENHKWAGCLGFIEENKNGRLMIGVPIPEQGIAYIYAFENDVYIVGHCMEEE